MHAWNLTYKGDHNTNLIKSIKTLTKKSLLEKHDVRIILTGTKLRSQFNIKYDKNIRYKHDLVYFSRFSSTTYTDSYIGEKARRLSERLMDHGGRGTKAHVVRHCLNTNHETVNCEHFNILDIGYNKNAYRRRIYEAFFVKQYRPSPTVQDNSVPFGAFQLVLILYLQQPCKQYWFISF